MEPITILGNLVIPDDRISENRELVRANRNVYWEHRTPQTQKGIDCCGAEAWHTDGNIPALITWASSYPTEILLDDSIVTAEPYDVVLLDNRAVKHRAPVDFTNDVRDAIRFGRPMPNRHFIRAQLNIVPSDAEIEQWRQELIKKQNNLNPPRRSPFVGSY